MRRQQNPLRLGHDMAIHQHLTNRGSFKTGQQAQDRRFPAARRTKECGMFPSKDTERHLGENRVSIVRF